MDHGWARLLLGQDILFLETSALTGENVQDRFATGASGEED